MVKLSTLGINFEVHSCNSEYRDMFSMEYPHYFYKKTSSNMFMEYFQYWIYEEDITIKFLHLWCFPHEKESSYKIRLNMWKTTHGFNHKFFCSPIGIHNVQVVITLIPLVKIVNSNIGVKTSFVIIMTVTWYQGGYSIYD